MKILTLGGDSRMKYASEALGAEEYSELTTGTFDVIVLPMPLKGVDFEQIRRFAEYGTVIFAGGESEELTGICADCGLPLVNYAKYEPLTLKNAALTAEAAVCLLSESTDKSLLGSRILITGYGRIASMLAARLKAFGAEVTIAARRAEQRMQAELDGFSAIPISEIRMDFDYIVNTVPADIFGNSLGQARGVFLELASLPPNPPENPELKYIHGGGLPGKYYPETAGKYIAEAINKLRGDGI